MTHTPPAHRSSPPHPRRLQPVGSAAAADRRRAGRPVAMALLLLLGTLVVGVAPAAATHFRGGNMSWQVDPTYNVPGRARIVIAYDSSWRWSFSYGTISFPPAGSQISNPSAGLSVTPAGGQSTFYSPQQTVLSVDAAGDLFLGRSQLIVDYALSDFPLTVETSGGNRLSTLEEGNHDSTWRLTMVVPRPDASQASSPNPSVPFPHRIVLVVNSPAAIFLPKLTGADFPNVAFATRAESTLSGNIRPVGETAGFCPFAGGCPTCDTSDAGPCANAMKITPEGVLTWTPQRTGLFAVQVAMKSGDGTARVPLDLLLDVRQANGCFDGNGQPTSCASLIPTLSVAPAYTVTAQVPSIAVTATFAGGGNASILNTPLAGSVVHGSSSGPSPLHSSLTWTPAPDDADTQQVCFQAITDGGLVSDVECTTVTWSLCREGTFSATGNAPCTPCPYGTFAHGLGQTSCTTCTPGMTGPPFSSYCPREFWYREACTATEDQICVRCNAACGIGTYCSGPDASDCIPFDTVCHRGSYSATGAEPCTLCAPGSYTEYWAQTSCEPCAPGTYRPEAGYPDCRGCPSGTFAADPGHASCTPCTSSCPAGQHLSGSCTPTTDRTCAPCTTSCPAGQYLSGSCTATTDPTCTPCTTSCPAGEFLSGSCTATSDDTTCTPCTTSCPAGEFLSGSCTATADATCTACTTSCPAGEYLSGSCSATDDAACAACDPSCATCSGPGPDACTSSAQCAPGTYSATGMEPCTACAPGSFANAEGQTSCTLCAPGTYAADAGRSACSPCDPGFFTDAQGQQLCSPCTAACASGEYLASACTPAADATCAACDASCTTCSGPGAAACTACASGDAPVGGACVPGCTAAPASGCRLPAVGGKAKLDIKDSADDKKDLLKWSWLKGSATALADFGNPVATDAYFLCVYDAGVRVSSTTLPAGGTCGKKPCWAAKKTSFNYKDTELTSDGTLTAKLMAGAAGKADISVQAKGVNLETPNLTTLTGPIRVQLQRAGGVCFESVFGAPFKKNAKGTFSDLAD